MNKISYVGGIQRFSTEDGPGIRTTIFVKGCPLHCQWCHNAELISYDYQLHYQQRKCIKCGECISKCPVQAISFSDGQLQIKRDMCIGCNQCVEYCCSGAMYTKSNLYSIDELMEIIEKDRPYYMSSNGGITLSGGEILSHGRYAVEIAKEARKRGINVAIETSGYGEYDILKNLAALCTDILFDIKHMDRELHKQYVGVYPDLIWKNLQKLCEDDFLRSKITIRVPLISKVNDSEQNLFALALYMKKLGLTRIHILPYHNMGISKAKEINIMQKEFETPNIEQLKQVYALLAAYDLEITIMGQEDKVC